MSGQRLALHTLEGPCFHQGHLQVRSGRAYTSGDGPLLCPWPAGGHAGSLCGSFSSAQCWVLLLESASFPTRVCWFSLKLLSNNWQSTPVGSCWCLGSILHWAGMLLWRPLWLAPTAPGGSPSCSSEDDRHTECVSKPSVPFTRGHHYDKPTSCMVLATLGEPIPLDNYQS